MTMKNRLLLIPLILIAGCSRSSMSAADFMTWANSAESGLVKKKELNGLIYTAMYRPAAYIALQNEGRKNKATSVAGGLEEISATQHFVLQVESTDAADVLAVNAVSAEEYHARVIYLSYGVQECFLLADGADTLTCRLAQFEQMFGAAPYIRLSLVFDDPVTGNVVASNTRNAQVNDKTLIYDDIVWGNGRMKFRIKATDLNNIPEITK